MRNTCLRRNGPALSPQRSIAYSSSENLIYRKGWWNYLGRHPRLIRALRLGPQTSYSPNISPGRQDRGPKKHLVHMAPDSWEIFLCSLNCRRKMSRSRFVMRIGHRSPTEFVISSRWSKHRNSTLNGHPVISPRTLLQIYTVCIAARVSASQVYRRPDEHLSLLWRKGKDKIKFASSSNVR